MYTEPLNLILLFCETLNVVISICDWTPNSEFFGFHKSPAKPKDPLNVSPPDINPQKCLHTSISPRIIRDFTVLVLNLQRSSNVVWDSTPYLYIDTGLQELSILQY